jgi:hypothetical protein
MRVRVFSLMARIGAKDCRVFRESRCKQYLEWILVTVMTPGSNTSMRRVTKRLDCLHDFARNWNGVES